MNKRGDIPMVLLFFSALFLAVAALFVMASFKGGLGVDSEGKSKIINEMAFLENYIIAKTKEIAYELIGGAGQLKDEVELKKRFAEIASEKNYGIKGMENYYGRILRGEFEFNRDAEKYWFEMKGLSLKVSRGANFIERNIDLRIEFDYSGDVVTDVRVLVIA